MTTVKTLLISLIIFFSFTGFTHAADTSDDWWYTNYDSQTQIANASTTTTTTTTTTTDAVTGQATTMPVSGTLSTTLTLATLGLFLVVVPLIYRRYHHSRPT